MITRLSVPLCLLVYAFLFIISGFVTANENYATTLRTESAINEYKRLRAATSPVRQRIEVWKVLKTIALELSYEDRKRMVDIIVRYSGIHGHDPMLLLAVIEIESGYRRNAISNVGAVGLMQVRPFVARSLAKELKMSPERASLLHDLDVNVKIGSYYLAKMLKRFGDLSLALEAYNLGPTKLSAYLQNGQKLKKRYTKKVFRSHARNKALVGDQV